MRALAVLDLLAIDEVTGAHLGHHDVACPWCGPSRRSPVNQRRRVLRIWRLDAAFASFHCTRCGEQGFVRNRASPWPDRAALEESRREAADRERLSKVERLSRARWLWSKRVPIAGTTAERYLRNRGYQGPLPATLGFLPGRGKHGPAMIAAFGNPGEPEPGVLSITAADVAGVHITRLAPDGAGKAGTSVDKIMLGSSSGSPIALAPPNDLLGLAVTEGIEDGLTAYKVTGLGVWAAGSAGFMPKLAEYVPSYIEALTIYAHDDPAGRDGARKLAARLSNRGMEVRIEGVGP
jgi:Toprim domain